MVSPCFYTVYYVWFDDIFFCSLIFMFSAHKKREESEIKFKMRKKNITY